MPILVGLSEQRWDVMKVVSLDPAKIEFATSRTVSDPEQTAAQQVQIRLVPSVRFVSHAWMVLATA